MEYDIAINQVDIIREALTDYEGFTRGEKKYCLDNLVEWVSEDQNLTTMIDKLEEKSLDARPFLKQQGLLD